MKLESADQEYEVRFGPIETSRSGTVNETALEPSLSVRSAVSSISRPSRRKRYNAATSRRPSDRTTAMRSGAVSPFVSSWTMNVPRSQSERTVHDENVDNCHVGASS